MLDLSDNQVHQEVLGLRVLLVILVYLVHQAQLDNQVLEVILEPQEPLVHQALEEIKGHKDLKGNRAQREHQVILGHRD